MRVGFHVSISGGFKNVIKRAKETNCDTIQCFSRNPRSWECKRLNPEDVKRFKEDMKRESIFPFFIHMPYLPNLATPERGLYERSLKVLCEELIRAEILGACYVVVHIGKKKASSLDDALKRVSFAINEALSKVPNNVILLLENTSGQGTEIGDRVSHLRMLLESIDDKKRVGICFDTAHAFQAGYDIATTEGLETFLKEFDQSIGIEKIHLIHLNDSKTPLGSHIDRHWHIGKGFIGKEAFKRILNHPLLRHIPAIMETPWGKEKDLANMKTVRELIKK